MVVPSRLLLFTWLALAASASADPVPRFEFSGNRALSSEELHGAIALAAQDPSAPTDDLVRRDVLAVLGAYYDRGYANAYIGAVKLDQTNNTVTIVIREGSVFMISSVHVTGELLGDEGDELARLVSHPNTAVSRPTVSRDCEELTEAYADEGYAFVSVVPEANLDFVHSTVDLNFEIARGPRVTVASIKILGNQVVPDDVIRKQLALSVGDRFSLAKLLTSKRRLLALPAIKDVMVAVEHGPTPDRAIVIFQITELPVTRL